MKKIKIISVLFFITFVLFGCAAEQTKPVPDPKPIEIRIPDPCHYGFVMFRTPEGNETMYSTNIDIQNDGRDGNAIYIVLDKGVIQQ